MEVVIERSPPKLKATGSTISPDIDQSSILSLSVHPGLKNVLTHTDSTNPPTGMTPRLLSDKELVQKLD
jgi:hypothetical protein